MKTAVIIVTHNSQAVLDRCLAALAAQTAPPVMVALIDSGSENSGSVQAYCQQPGFIVRCAENIGFGQANNLGWQAVRQAAEAVLFLNPDAFLAPDSIERAGAVLADTPAVGCVGGRLLGFDVASGQPTGRLDSTGVFRTYYGRWYDRDQGQPDCGQHSQIEEVPAVCGAFLLARTTALDQTALPGGAVFDPAFFLYKEDIELCIRLRRADWKIVYLPDVQAYHCRGWQQNRTAMPAWLRLTAAGNEVLLYRRHPSPYMLWALLKYAAVRWLRL